MTDLLAHLHTDRRDLELDKHEERRKPGFNLAEFATSQLNRSGFAGGSNS